MKQDDRIAAVVPEGDNGITAREAATLAGLPPDAAQKAIQRLLTAGRVRRQIPPSYPARYLRNRAPALEAYVPTTTVQHAMRTVPNSVFALAR
ncbi:hypothetical protein LJR130_003812 [Variovorax sp. LjRoot130]|uniref:hypothetical protein n=1 Tax=unclassified Variovorax TaxID=663243 RepID=UPI003ED16F5B